MEAAADHSRRRHPHGGLPRVQRLGARAAVSGTTCPVCTGTRLEAIGTVAGRTAGRDFHLAHCLDCRFSWVTDPWTDYANIYSEAYYHGRGADPYVDYVFELEHP